MRTKSTESTESTEMMGNSDLEQKRQPPLLHTFTPLACLEEGFSVCIIYPGMPSHPILTGWLCVCVRAQADAEATPFLLPELSAEELTEQVAEILHHYE